MGEKTTTGGSFRIELTTWLASLRITVYTLILLGIATLIGTIIPQFGVVSDPEQLLELKRRVMTETPWIIMHRLGFTNVFRSIWFLFLVALLAANLIACTLVYLGNNRRRLAAIGPELDEAAAEKVGKIRRFKTAGDAAALEKRLRTIGKVARSEREGIVYLFSQNSPVFRLGVVVVHASIVLIIIGALVSLFGTVEGFLYLAGGGASRVFVTDKGEALYLPFELACRDVDRTFYANSRTPSDYFSTLIVRRDGQDVREKKIEVNHPLKYGGYTFFQSAMDEIRQYGLKIDAGEWSTVLPILPPNLWSLYTLPEGNDGFVARGAGRLSTGGEGGEFGFLVGGREYDLLLEAGGEAQAAGKYTVQLLNARERLYTGLQVVKNPSVPFLYAGFGLFFLGLMFVLYTAHRRVWVRVENGQASLAGLTSRNREKMDDWLDRTVELCRKG